MLENCRWLLYVSRIYGCHPHTIRERSPSTRARFRALALYSLFACGVYIVVAYNAADLLPCVPVKAMIVGCALLRVGRYVRCSYMILTTLLSCLRHAEFERAVLAAREFDDLTRRRRRWLRASLSSSSSSSKRHRTQWIVIFAIYLAWLIFAILATFLSTHNVFSFTLIVQCATRAAFSMQVAKFCFLYDALRRRFHRLDGFCRELSGGASSPIAGPAAPVVQVKNIKSRTSAVGADESGAHSAHGEPLAIWHLQRLHRCLADATNHLSSHYGLQLFFWIACLLIDIVMFAFFLIYNVNSARQIIVYCTMLLYLSLQVIALSHVCHLTCGQANGLARTVFSAETSAHGFVELSTEAIELGVYLRAHPLRIRVLSLFNLDNRFVYTAFGVILMYVILASSLH